MTITIFGFPDKGEWNSPLNATQQRFFLFKLACLVKTEPTTVATMTTSIKVFAVAGALLFTLALGIVTGTPEQEKAFAYAGGCQESDDANGRTNRQSLPYPQADEETRH
jgi:hypothetical protein